MTEKTQCLSDEALQAKPSSRRQSLDLPYTSLGSFRNIWITHLHGEAHIFAHLARFDFVPSDFAIHEHIQDHFEAFDHLSLVLARHCCLKLLLCLFDCIG